MGHGKSSSKREVYSFQQTKTSNKPKVQLQSYLRKQEQTQINNLTLHLKQLEKEEQTKPKVSRRKEVIKIKAEINKIER